MLCCIQKLILWVGKVNPTGIPGRIEENPCQEKKDMEFNLLNQLFISTSISGLFVVMILLYVSRGPTFPNRLLAGSIFSIALTLFHLAMIRYGWILKVPHLFRMTSPWTYLIIPLGYLYTRSILRDETGFRKYDWLHFLPALVHAVELLPFFLQSTAEKQTYLADLITSPGPFTKVNEGLLPGYLHELLKPVIALFYLFFQWKLLWSYYRSGNGSNGSSRKKELFTWLTIFTAGYSLLVLLIITVAASKDYYSDALFMVLSIITLVLILLLSFLFLKP